MSCGICLEKLKEPVSIPCGHVFCADPCLSAHVAATSTEGFTAACPACREPFFTVRPELACLPKPFHKFALPSLRRLYIDIEALEAPRSRRSTLQGRLAASEARVAALESDKERLLRAGEQHAAAARAHSRGETEALRKAASLVAELQKVRAEVATAHEKTINLAGQLAELSELQQVTLGNLDESSAAIEDLKAKYSKLKRHCKSLEAKAGREERDSSMNGDSSNVIKKRTSDVADSVEAQGSTPKRLRVIRPLPRGRSSLQTPISAGLLARLGGQGGPQTPPITAGLLARLGGQGGLGSPFRSGE